MTDPQTRRYNASQAGTGIMDIPANNAIWTGTASIANLVTKIKANQTEIGVQKAIQTKFRGGVKDSKKNSKSAAGNKAHSMSRVLYVFAVDTGNTVLKEEVDFSLSTYTVGKDSSLVTLWDLVHARADTNSAALTAGGYLIAAGDITGLQGLIDTFTGWKPKPVMGKAEKKAATTAIKTEDAKQTVNIDLLLDSMAPLAVTNTNFYNAAQDGFEINNSGNRHVANWFMFVDDETGIRLSGITGTREGWDGKKKASKRGIIQVMYEEVGNANSKWTFVKPGYVTVVKDGIVSEEGKMNRMEFRLVKV